VGSRFDEVLEGATTPDGRPADLGDGTSVPGSVRLTLPRLGGEFEVARGPYLGAEQGNRPGTVWVLRRLALTGT